MATISITSNDGALDSASAVLEVTATNPEFNQPALRIKQASCRGGAASIRIDDPNPDIEFVETEQDPNDPAKESTRLRFSPISSRSMAATLAILGLRRFWLCSGWRQAAISALGQGVSLARGKASSRLLMRRLRPQ